MPGRQAAGSAPNRLRFLFLLVLLLPGCWAWLLNAGEAKAGDRPGYSSQCQSFCKADALFGYAMDRFETGDYETAVFEFKRFVYFFPDHARTDAAFFHIARSHFRTGRYEAALGYYQKTVQKFPDSEFAEKSRFQISRCYFRMNDPDAAMQTLYRLSQTSQDRAVRDKAFFRMAWFSLELAKPGQARTWLDRLSPEGRRSLPVAGLLEKMDKIDSLPRKSPFLAGLASVIPGGGYLYCGRYQDAAVAFGINAALMGAAYESWDNDLEVLGGVITLVELGFYGGSIYGGISSAHKANRAVYRQFIRDLKREGFSAELSAMPNEPGVRLSFTYRW